MILLHQFQQNQTLKILQNLEEKVIENPILAFHYRKTEHVLYVMNRKIWESETSAIYKTEASLVKCAKKHLESNSKRNVD